MGGGSWGLVGARGRPNAQVKLRFAFILVLSRFVRQKFCCTRSKCCDGTGLLYQFTDVTNLVVAQKLRLSPREDVRLRHLLSQHWNQAALVTRRKRTWHRRSQRSRAEKHPGLFLRRSFTQCD